MEIKILRVFIIYSLGVTCKVDHLAGPMYSSSSYSFLEDLNSPNQPLATQEELDEIAGDPNANLAGSDSTDSNTENDQDINEEYISNENAGSGLTVSLGYFRFICTKSLFSSLVVGWNSPLANEKLEQKI